MVMMTSSDYSSSAAAGRGGEEDGQPQPAAVALVTAVDNSNHTNTSAGTLIQYYDDHDNGSTNKDGNRLPQQPQEKLSQETQESQLKKLSSPPTLPSSSLPSSSPSPSPSLSPAQMTSSAASMSSSSKQFVTPPPSINNNSSSRKSSSRNNNSSSNEWFYHADSSSTSSRRSVGISRTTSHSHSQTIYSNSHYGPNSHNNSKNNSSSNRNNNSSVGGGSSSSSRSQTHHYGPTAKSTSVYDEDPNDNPYWWMMQQRMQQGSVAKLLPPSPILPSPQTHQQPSPLSSPSSSIHRYDGGHSHSHSPPPASSSSPSRGIDHNNNNKNDDGSGSISLDLSRAMRDPSSAKLRPKRTAAAAGNFNEYYEVDINQSGHEDNNNRHTMPPPPSSMPSNGGGGGHDHPGMGQKDEKATLNLHNSDRPPPPAASPSPNSPPPPPRTRTRTIDYFDVNSHPMQDIRGVESPSQHQQQQQHQHHVPRDEDPIFQHHHPHHPSSSSPPPPPNHHTSLFATIQPSPSSTRTQTFHDEGIVLVAPRQSEEAEGEERFHDEPALPSGGKPGTDRSQQQQQPLLYYQIHHHPHAHDQKSQENGRGILVNKDAAAAPSSDERFRDEPAFMRSGHYPQQQLRTYSHDDGDASGAPLLPQQKNHQQQQQEEEQKPMLMMFTPVNVTPVSFISNDSDDFHDEMMMMGSPPSAPEAHAQGDERSRSRSLPEKESPSASSSSSRRVQQRLQQHQQQRQHPKQPPPRGTSHRRKPDHKSRSGKEASSTQPYSMPLRRKEDRSVRSMALSQSQSSRRLPRQEKPPQKKLPEGQVGMDTSMKSVRHNPSFEDENKDDFDMLELSLPSTRDDHNKKSYKPLRRPLFGREKEPAAATAAAGGTGAAKNNSNKKKKDSKKNRGSGTGNSGPSTWTLRSKRILAVSLAACFLGAMAGLIAWLHHRVSTREYGADRPRVPPLAATEGQTFVGGAADKNNSNGDGTENEGNTTLPSSSSEEDNDDDTTTEEQLSEPPSNFNTLCAREKVIGGSFFAATLCEALCQRAECCYVPPSPPGSGKEHELEEEESSPSQNDTANTTNETIIDGEVDNDNNSSSINGSNSTRRLQQRQRRLSASSESCFHIGNNSNVCQLYSPLCDFIYGSLPMVIVSSDGEGEEDNNNTNTNATNSTGDGDTNSTNTTTTPNNDSSVAPVAVQQQRLLPLPAPEDLDEVCSLDSLISSSAASSSSSSSAMTMDLVQTCTEACYDGYCCFSSAPAILLGERNATSPSCYEIPGGEGTAGTNETMNNNSGIEGNWNPMCLDYVPCLYVMVAQVEELQKRAAANAAAVAGNDAGGNGTRRRHQRQRRRAQGVSSISPPPPPRPDLDLVCSDASLKTQLGVIECVAACYRARCCDPSLDADDSCLLLDPSTGIPLLEDSNTCLLYRDPCDTFLNFVESYSPASNSSNTANNKTDDDDDDDKGDGSSSGNTPLAPPSDDLENMCSSNDTWAECRTACLDFACCLVSPTGTEQEQEEGDDDDAAEVTSCLSSQWEACQLYEPCLWLGGNATVSWNNVTDDQVLQLQNILLTEEEEEEGDSGDDDDDDDDEEFNSMHQSHLEKICTPSSTGDADGGDWVECVDLCLEAACCFANSTTTNGTATNDTYANTSVVMMIDPAPVGDAMTTPPEEDTSGGGGEEDGPESCADETDFCSYYRICQHVLEIHRTAGDGNITNITSEQMMWEHLLGMNASIAGDNESGVDGDDEERGHHNATGGDDHGHRHNNATDDDNEEGEEGTSSLPSLDQIVDAHEVCLPHLLDSSIEHWFLCVAFCEGAPGCCQIAWDHSHYNHTDDNNGDADNVSSCPDQEEEDACAAYDACGILPIWVDHSVSVLAAANGSAPANLSTSLNFLYFHLYGWGTASHFNSSETNLTDIERACYFPEIGGDEGGTAGDDPSERSLHAGEPPVNLTNSNCSKLCEPATCCFVMFSMEGKPFGTRMNLPVTNAIVESCMHDVDFCEPFTPCHVLHDEILMVLPPEDPTKPVDPMPPSLGNGHHHHHHIDRNSTNETVITRLCGHNSTGTEGGGDNEDLDAGAQALCESMCMEAMCCFWDPDDEADSCAEEIDFCSYYDACGDILASVIGNGTNHSVVVVVDDDGNGNTTDGNETDSSPSAAINDTINLLCRPEEAESNPAKQLMCESMCEESECCFRNPDTDPQSCADEVEFCSYYMGCAPFVNLVLSPNNNGTNEGGNATHNNSSSSSNNNSTQNLDLTQNETLVVYEGRGILVYLEAYFNHTDDGGGGGDEEGGGGGGEEGMPGSNDSTVNETAEIVVTVDATDVEMAADFFEEFLSTLNVSGMVPSNSSLESSIDGGGENETDVGDDDDEKANNSTFRVLYLSESRNLALYWNATDDMIDEEAEELIVEAMDEFFGDDDDDDDDDDSAGHHHNATMNHTNLTDPVLVEEGGDDDDDDENDGGSFNHTDTTNHTNMTDPIPVEEGGDDDDDDDDASQHNNSTDDNGSNSTTTTDNGDDEEEEEEEEEDDDSLGSSNATASSEPRQQPLSLHSATELDGVADVIKEQLNSSSSETDAAEVDVDEPDMEIDPAPNDGDGDGDGDDEDGGGGGSERSIHGGDTVDSPNDV